MQIISLANVEKSLSLPPPPPPHIAPSPQTPYTPPTPTMGRIHRVDRKQIRIPDAELQLCEHKENCS